MYIKLTGKEVQTTVVVEAEVKNLTTLIIIADAMKMKGTKVNI
jgi:hypothetical protein